MSSQSWPKTSIYRKTCNYKLGCLVSMDVHRCEQVERMIKSESPRIGVLRGVCSADIIHGVTVISPKSRPLKAKPINIH